MQIADLVTLYAYNDWANQRILAATARLTPEQFTRYEKFYHDPQLFHRTPFGILVEHCTTERYAAAMDAVSRPRRPPSRQAPER